MGQMSGIHPSPSHSRKASGLLICQNKKEMCFILWFCSFCFIKEFVPLVDGYYAKVRIYLHEDPYLKTLENIMLKMMGSKCTWRKGRWENYQANFLNENCVIQERAVQWYRGS